MIWKGVSAHSPIEYAGIIRVFPSRAEVEHPEVLSVSMFEELLRVLSAIAVQAFHTGRRIAHDDDLVSDVHQVYAFRLIEKSVYQAIKRENVTDWNTYPVLS